MNTYNTEPKKYVFIGTLHIYRAYHPTYGSHRNTIMSMIVPGESTRAVRKKG